MLGRVGGDFGRMGLVRPAGHLAGASLDLNFVASSGYPAAPSLLLTTTRSSSGDYADNSAGVWSSFAANIPRITDKGLLVEEARTNLFLQSGTPATQSITVVSSSVYTVSVVGTGSVTLSGAGTGVASQGTPVTFTAGSTSLTVTTAGITGAFVNVNVELGAFATSPIRTTSAAATRAADGVTTAMAGTSEGAVVVYARTAPGIGATNQALWCWDDGTNQNRLLLYRRTSDRLIVAEVNVASVNQAPINLGAVADDTAFKVGLSWKANDFVALLNGGTPVTDASGSVPAGLTTVRHGATTGGVQWNGAIQREAIFPAYRSAAQLQALTA
jgi:hypothetical protein